MEMTFNNKPLSDFNTYYDGSQMFDTPEKDITFYSIPGKNGDLSISNDRFNNVELSVDCFIRENYITNYNNLVNYLYSQEGYGRLEYSQENDIFREGAFVKAIKPDTGAFLKYGSFTLVFNCKPQKWLKSGETAISVSGSSTITNPTLMTAKPLIKVNGIGSITINDSELVLDTNTGITYIDCELEDAYEGTINRNPNLTITNGFPKLYAGDNTIIVEDCTIEIIPRWWRI